MPFGKCLFYYRSPSWPGVLQPLGRDHEIFANQLARLEALFVQYLSLIHI